MLPQSLYFLFKLQTGVGGGQSLLPTRVDSPSAFSPTPRRVGFINGVSGCPGIRIVPCGALEALLPRGDHRGCVLVKDGQHEQRRGESQVFVEDRQVVLLIKHILEFLCSGQAHTVAPVVSKTFLVLAFEMDTAELWHMDISTRQMFGKWE